MTKSSIDEQQRQAQLQQLANVTGSRRDMIKAAAVAGLIPVLSTSTMAARAAAKAQDEQPVQGGTFTTLGHQEISAISPERDETVVWVAVAQVFSALYNVNEQFELEPILAESYEASDDGLEYTFRLREGVTFHNGDPFTSADVVYTYEWIMDEENASTRGSLFDLVDSVEATDDYTVVFTLSEPDVTFLVNVPTQFIWPAEAHAEAGEDDFSANPIGTGPYVLDEWVPAQTTRLVANEDFFLGRPNFDVMQIDIVSEAVSRAAALETGEADNSIWSLNAEDNLALEESGDFQVIYTLQNAVNHFALNNEHPILSDVNVRRALLHLLDRDAMINDIYQGLAEPATSHLSPNVEAFYTDDVMTYDHDPERAAELLDEAGWEMGDNGVRERDGEPLEFTIMLIQGDTQRRPQAEVFQQWASEAGITINLEEAPTTQILDWMVDGERDAALFNWVYGGGSGEPDARGTLSSTGANNFSRFQNEEVDQLLEDGIREQDEDARVEIYQRIQEIVAEEVPFLYMLHLQGYTFYANAIQGVPEEALSTDALYHKIWELWREDEG